MSELGQIDDSVPTDFSSLKATIDRLHPSLPRRLLQCARFVVDNPDEVALGTTKAVAKAAGVQPSTLVRFAQAAGFSGSNISNLRSWDRRSGSSKVSWQTRSRPWRRPPGKLMVPDLRRRSGFWREHVWFMCSDFGGRLRSPTPCITRSAGWERARFFWITLVVFSWIAPRRSTPATSFSS